MHFTTGSEAYGDAGVARTLNGHVNAISTCPVGNGASTHGVVWGHCERVVTRNEGVGAHTHRRTATSEHDITEQTTDVEYSFNGTKQAR